MKLTVIGGGGVRSMFLAKSIAQRAEELHIDELVFMDNDSDRKSTRLNSSHIQKSRMPSSA